MSNHFVFITDLHLTTSAGVRTGDPLQDCLDKLSYVIDYANTSGARILIGGDVFDNPTVPYEAYTKVCNVLRRAKEVPLAIKGNHDQLFRCDDNDRKTTLFNAFQMGVLEELSGTIDLGPCYVTSDKSLVNRDKPQILVFHGFLNIKDGKHTLYADDLVGVTTPTIVLLGHDHVEYDPVTLGSCTVYRIGSMFRNRRVETSDRAPKMLDIRVTSSGFVTKLMEIPCRPVAEIFRETVGKSEKVEETDYMSLISELKEVSGEDLKLMSVVERVASSRVSEYMQSLLESAKVKNIN